MSTSTKKRAPFSQQKFVLDEDEELSDNLVREKRVTTITVLPGQVR